jgi:hypothetical protein
MCSPQSVTGVKGCVGMRGVGRIVACVMLALLVVACSAIPRVELTAYVAAYSDIQAVTNGVLDIVAPYERVVIRFAARNTASLGTFPGAAASGSASEKILDAMAQAAPAPTPTPAPTPNAAGASQPAKPAANSVPTSPASAGPARPPRPTPKVDPELLLPKPSTARPARPTPQIDPGLLADPATAKPPPRTGSVIIARSLQGFRN